MTDKITTTITVEVDEQWIDFATKYHDIFKGSYCGYWIYGIQHDSELGWLCFEHEERRYLSDVLDDPEFDNIVSAWKRGDPLPDKWHRLNKDAAIKAWSEGVKLYGASWYDKSDSTSYDCVIQMSLLGRIVYG